MSNWSEVTSTTVPCTLGGLYLHTVVRRESADEDRDRIVDEMERAGWIDVDQTVKAAFDIAVARIYGPDSDVRYIRELIADRAQWFSEEIFSPTAAEALIRASRAEMAIRIDDIPIEVAFNVHLAILLAICDTLGYTAEQADQLIAEGETLAERRGLHPTPVPREHWFGNNPA